MSISSNLTSVTAYLRGGGVTDGFLQLSVSNDLLKKPEIIHHVFLGRKTAKVVFIASQALNEEADELIVVYDKDLQAGPRGLIDCPYLVLRRVRISKEFVDLTMQHKDDIIAVIEDLQRDQASIDEKRKRRVARAYYISADRWSGIIGVIIAETQNGNFLVQGLSTIVTEAQNIKTSVVNLKNDSGTRRCFCIYDKKRHNDGTNTCPYLIFGTYHGYKVQNMMEDDVLDVAEVIERVQKHVPKETEE